MHQAPTEQSAAGKVCHVAASAMTVRVLLAPQLQFLAGCGYRVHAVCTPENKTVDIPGVKITGISISRKFWSPWQDWVAFWQLYRYFKKEHFDLVHTHSPKAALLGQWAARLAGVRSVVNTVHGLYFTDDTPPPMRHFLVWLEKCSAAASSLIFSQNQEDIATMQKENIAPAEKVKHLGNGINLDYFNLDRFNDAFKSKKRESLQIPRKAKVVGMVGRLVREKGYLELFEAFQRIRKTHPRALLICIGPQEPQKHDAISQKDAEHYGIADQVKFLGERNDMDELYSIMNVFVLPSWREGFPRSVMEAMAMQLPVVVTNIRGCREEVDDQKNGLLVPQKNAEELANAIASMLNHPEEAQRMAMAARQKAAAAFDETAVFHRIEEAYDRLLKKS